MEEQRATIKAFVKSGKTATETYKFLQEAYGEETMCRSRVFKWFKEFKEGRESFESKRGHHQKTLVRTEENVDRVRNILTSDRRLTIADLSLSTGLAEKTIHRILTEDLGLKKLTARWVPRLLTDDHKTSHLEFSRNFIKSHFEEGTAFLRRIVTCDESWVNFYTPELKSQSQQWLPKGSNPPIKAKRVASEKKTMLILFFDFEGPIYQHHVPKATTINSKYYCEVLERFLTHLRRKRPEKFKGEWLLHQDNARPHTSRETSAFLEAKKIKLLGHPAYSPDLAPCDFWAFPQIKKELAGQRFDTETALQIAVQGVLGRLADGGLLHVFETWSKRCDKCIQVSGDYVEKS